ncbi:MAG: PQQ-dependent sugar dehydrogenase [Actinomycetota bacterium]|nr:PQQ-dependent sugar dehydrogenase [Actinomycetota bacterium]
MAVRRRVTALLCVLAAMLSLTPVAAASSSISAQPVVSGLAYPTMFTFAADGRIFYTELLTGNVGIFDPATGSTSLYHRVRKLCTDADQGLFGVALHPDYPSRPFVYVYATRNVKGACRNQVLRLKQRSDGTVATSVLHSEPYTGEHIGGRIMFGPDRYLYISTGEGGNPANAQDLSNGKGKMLRMTASGKIPADNPIAGSYVYAYGFRNVFGFDFDPVTSQLWATENGPECNDELNRVEPSGNYGWGPSGTCSTPPQPPANTNQDGPDPILPLLWYSPSDGPTGAAFCSGCGLGADIEGHLLYGAWQYGEIRAVTLDADRAGVVSQTVVYRHHVAEAPLGIESAPDGRIYFSDKTTIYRLVAA